MKEETCLFREAQQEIQISFTEILNSKFSKITQLTSEGGPVPPI